MYVTDLSVTEAFGFIKYDFYIICLISHGYTVIEIKCPFHCQMLLILLKWHLLIKGHTTLHPSRLPWPGLPTGILNPGGHPHWPVTCCSQKQQLFLDLPPLDDPTAPASTSVLELPHLAMLREHEETLFKTVLLNRRHVPALSTAQAQ